MSGHRWNNRFNPPLETASVRFPRAAIEAPQVPANRTTHQMPGAPTPILYTNQITQIPNLSLSFVSSNAIELTVTLDVSFDYRMKGTDHYEFTFTNSNTGISTTKSYQQSGNVYTIGEFDPGTNYSVYVTPVINGLFTASSATTTFLSSPATAPGLIQGAVLTGSGSFAVIKFAGVYPSSPFPNQIAVNDNFGNPQVLVNVTSALKTIVIGPYTDGLSYQFQITPVTVLGGIYRYGTPTGIPTNYFIPGPPGTPQVTSITADNTTVSFSVCADTAFHPFPDYYQIVMCKSTLTPITTLTGLSGQINDLSTTYASFSISGLSPSLFYTLSAGVGSCNLIADITNDAGLWYSFRVTNMSVSGGNTYFTNPYLPKTVLTGTSFTVNFNTLGITSVISTVSALSTVSSSVVVGGVRTTFDPSGAIFTVSPVQTDTFTTFITQTFANKVFSVGSDYGTIFAGPPFLPGYGNGPEIGNETFRWTVERASGPRPIYYTFFGTGITTISTTALTGTVSGLTNGTTYQLSVNGFANNVTGNSTIADNLRPAFAPPVSLAVTNITSNTVTLSIGRPLGGSQFGYIITASGTGGTTTVVANSSASYISSVISGLQSVSYQFIAYTQTSGTPSANNLSAAAPGIYYLGRPFQPSNVRGAYLGSVSGAITTVSLTLTASRGLVSGLGPTVAQYNISDNFGNLYTAPALPNYDLQYTFPNLSAYVSYTFTITPFGNNVSGTAVTSSTFDFNPQPPTSPNLFMTGNNGGTMNITFTGTTFPSSTTDYYTISVLQAPFVGGGTRVDVPGSPVSYPAEGFAYKFAIYKTICGVTSSTFVQTPQVTGGPPIAPFIGYTLGSNSIVFSLSVSPQSAVVISNFRITEYNKNTVNGSFQATGGTYVVPAITPGLSPSATKTISGLFTASYALVVPGGNFQWRETTGTTPQFSLISTTDDTLAQNTYPNLVTLRLTQSTSSLTFPVTTFSTFPPNLDYGTTLTTKPTTVFDPAQSLTFTWCSGVGPFTGGTYRYDIQSLGGDTLTSASASVIIDLYVAAPGTPSVVTNNASATVTFAAPPSTSVPPQYYEVTDNYGRTISGTTTLSEFVFGQCVTGSAYSFFATSFAQGISSAPSQLSPVVFPGRPNTPNFVPSFGSNSTQKAFATLSTALSSISYIPVTDILLSVSGVASYGTTKTNTQTPYTNTTGGPTYTLTDLSLGTSYTFTICAFANQVYSTPTSYNYYVGSLTPNGQPTIVLSNTTAYVSVSAANTASKLGGVNPNTYVFLFSGPNTGSDTIPYNSTSSTYTGVLTGLTALSNYTFSGYTITNGISYGGAWSDLRTFNAGGPRPSVSPHITYSVLGNPLTQTVSLQVVIFTGCAGVKGLWADTSYYINVSPEVAPVPGPVTFNTPGAEGTFKPNGAGNVDVIVSGGGGGAGARSENKINGKYLSGYNGGAGGLVIYSFPNVPARTLIQYKVGGGGNLGMGGSGMPGESSYVRINDLNTTITAGGGGGGGQPLGQPGSDAEAPYGGAGGIDNVGEDGRGGPVGIVRTGGGGSGGVGDQGSGGGGQGGYVTISAAGYTFSTMTVSSFVVPVQTGNTYYASVYTVKNQVTGSLFPASGFVIPPAPPLNPTITLTPTPNTGVLPTNPIPATITWGQSATSDVLYFYSVNGGTYVNNSTLTTGQISLDYGSTSKISVYSIINGVSSAAIESASAYVFTNPPTTLTYGRTLTSVTLSWASAFQPAYPSNTVYTVSSTSSTTASGVTITSAGGGPSITIGINIMSSTTYSTITSAVALGHPIVITLSSIGSTTAYRQSLPILTYSPPTPGIPGYKFTNSTIAGLPSYVGNAVMFITNPSALPTNGYTLSDLCSGVVIASNIYQNTYTWTGATLGNTYNLAVQALNSNLYSVARDASTGPFKLSTIPVSTLSATYNGGDVTLSWKTPQQFDGITPTTTPPYTWTIVDQSGSVKATSAGYTAATQSVTGLFPGLGGTYTYSIITNYYGVSSSPTAANQISLRTTPPPTVTQTTIGPGILVTWTAALQSVYLPENPTVLSNIPPNGGYKIVDLCGRYTGALTAGPTDTQIFVQIAEANLYNYYNFAVSASHNGIMSISTAPGAIFLGVDPVTNPSVTLNGMVATLTWNAPVSNGPNAPYRIFDSNGYQLGDRSRLTTQTVTFSNPGVYSVTTLATETIVANACGAGGSFAAGGFISNVYAVTAGTTIVVKVGEAGAGGGNSTVHVPNPGNPYLILDAGGGGGFTVSGEGFIRNGFPDGGGIQLPGSGSAGGGAQPIVGGGSAPSTDGRVQLTLTTASLASSIYTSATSISFTIANYTSYKIQIESSSNGLTRTASLTLNTNVSPPTGLITTFRGFILSNAWTPPAQGVPEYFITNLTTGDYNSNIFGSPSPFSVPGIPNTTYRFSIYSVSAGIPSSQTTSVAPVTLFCPKPTVFTSTYYGTTISFSVAVGTGGDYQTFTLTDGSGTVLQSNIPNFATGRGPPIAPIFGNIPGRLYTFNLFGVLSGLCSEPATTSISLTIPGSIRLGLPPYTKNVAGGGTNDPTVTGSNAVYIYDSTPVEDTWSIVPTYLQRTYNSYQGVPGEQYWISAAMSSNGCNVIAANNITTTGSNLWVSANGGLNWTSAGNTASRVGSSAFATAIALNGTTGALTTGVGLFMSSNVSGNATWVPVNTPVIPKAVAVSPDGYRIIIAPANTTGTLYYATMDGFPVLSFFGANGPPGFSQNSWSFNCLKWSGDGTTIIAAGGYDPKGYIYRSTDNGQTFSQLPSVGLGGTTATPARAYTSISINSNATIILASFNPNTTPAANQQLLYTYKYGVQNTAPTSWAEQGIGSGGGITVGTSVGDWRCTQSYFGDVMIVCDTGSSNVYVSYDAGFSWYKETRYAGSGFSACAISSNGLSEVLMGSPTYLQTIIATPQPSTTTILKPRTADGGQYLVPAGSDGYTITPLLKDIPGPQQFVWITPQAGPTVFPQTTGLASFVVPYASGYSLSQSYYWGYYVIDSNATWLTTTAQIVTKPSGYTDSPDLSVYTPTPTPAFPSTKSCLRIASPGAASDLIPGTYIINVNVIGGQKTTATVTIPLRPPPAPTLTGQGGTNIQAKWTPTVGVAYTTVTYNIYSNGNYYCNTTGGTATEKFADIPNTGIIPTTIGIEAVVGGITSARVSTSISPPLPPTGLLVTGYATSTKINLSWNVVSGHTYMISYGSTSTSGLAGPGTTGYEIPLALGSNIVIGLAAQSNNLLSAQSIITATNRVTGFNAPGLTVTRTIPSQFVITAMSIIGGGGGGGGGGYAIGLNNNGRQGGGGGGQGGTLLFTGGTAPIQRPSSITLYPGKAGNGGLYGGGGQGGQISYIQITGNNTVQTIAWAGGGGGGGGGNGGNGAAGGRLATNGIYGDGGTGGTTANVNGGGGGFGGWGSSFATTDPNITPIPEANYSTISGSNGDSRQGTYPNATTGGKGGGPGGGAAQSTPDTVGNFATGYGNGGGGGAPSSSGSSGSTTAPRGGAGSDGFISISYCFLTT